jgi:hypothetical protein
LSGLPKVAILLPPGAYTIGISLPGGGEEDVNFTVSDHDVILDLLDPMI